MPARKGSVQIRLEILEHLYYSAEPEPRTHVWRRATTLSYDDFQRHLAFLSGKGLVADSEEGLAITGEGRTVYERLRSALGSLL